MLTLWAGPLADAAREIADQVLEPSHYLRAVLEPGGRP